MSIGVISVTKQGDILGEKLKETLDIRLFSKNHIENFNIKAITEELMKSCEAVIFIASTGIAVRTVAPFLKGKEVDPAVLVIDCSGNFVISLLSGHLGGANELTLKVAEIIKAQPVITTATDNLGLIAPDIIAKDNDLVIEDLKKAKIIAAMLVEGKRVGFIDEKKLLTVPKGYVDSSKSSELIKFSTADKSTNNDYEGILTVHNGTDSEKLLTVPIVESEKVSTETEVQGLVYVTNKLNIPEGAGCNLISNYDNGSVETLRLIRKDIVLGIGCRKDYAVDKMGKAVRETLIKFNTDIRAVKAIATVEVKKDEKAINELAKALKCPIDIFTVDEIKVVQHKYKGSDFVEKTIGARAVCEPVVELSGAVPLTDKLALEGMTLCIGEMK